LLSLLSNDSDKLLTICREIQTLKAKTLFPLHRKRLDKRIVGTFALFTLFYLTVVIIGFVLVIVFMNFTFPFYHLSLEAMSACALFVCALLSGWIFFAFSAQNKGILIVFVC
jgi:hypothetical protein